MIKISVVIPCFNEEKTVKRVVESVLQYTPDVIVVDDCSTDKTRQILQDLPILNLRNQYNLGYCKSLEKGINKALSCGADYIITFDADGQHKASDLKEVIHTIKKFKPAMVIGKRSFKNRFMEHIWSLYSKRFNISDPLCGFKAYRKDTFIKYGKVLETRYTIATELMFKFLKDGGEIKEVNLSTEKRVDASRFANVIRGNYLELKALINVITI